MSPRPSLDQLLAEMMEARDRGEAVDARALAAEHPEHAAELLSFAADEEWMLGMATDLLGAPPTPQPLHEHMPAIPGFTLIREIARGGMGVVFEAQQHVPARRVALKTLRDAFLATAEDARRFEREAQAAAELDHPGIVRILEVGTAGGRGWYTMPLAEGGSLLAHLPRLVGRPRRAAQLVRDIARAVAHGHARGILHRDLKPSNVLLDLDGNPLVADFGLARRLGRSGGSDTVTGMILGTPAYMPPEQARGDVRVIDERTDIWSLGAILHHLLAGRPPHVGNSPSETLRLARAAQLQPIRSHMPSLPHGVAAICDQCLRASAAERYASMRDLADDLDRFLDGRAVKARRIGPVARASSWIRVHRTAMATLGLALLALIASLLAFNSERDREQEENQRRAREVLATAYRHSAADDLCGAAVHFAAASTLWPSRECQQGMRAHQTTVPTTMLHTDAAPLWRVRFALRGLFMVAGSDTGVLYRWDRQGSRTEIVHEDDVPLRAVAPHPSLTWCATGDDAGTLRLLDIGRTEIVKTLRPESRGEGGEIVSIVWIDQSRLLVGRLDGSVRVWRLTSAPDLVPVGQTWRVTKAEDEGVRSAAVVSSNEVWIGTGRQQGPARILRLQLETRAVTEVRSEVAGAAWDMHPHPAEHLVALSDDAGLRLIDTRTHELVWHAPHETAVGALAFDASGTRLFSGTPHGQVRAFDVASGAQVGHPLPHGAQVYGLACDPLARTVTSVGMDGIARTWPHPTGPADAVLLAESRAAPILVTAAPAQGHVLTGSLGPEDRTLLRLLAVDTGSLVSQQRTPNTSIGRGVPLALHAHESGWVLLIRPGGPGVPRAPIHCLHVRLVDGKLSVVPSGTAPGMPGTYAQVAGPRLATLVGGASDAFLYHLGPDVRLMGPRRLANVATGALSRNGVWLCRVHADRRTVFSVERASDGERLSTHTLGAEIARVAISNDGQRAALALRDDRRVVLFDLGTAQEIATIEQREVLQLRFTLDSRTLLAAGHQDRVQTWDTTTGGPVGRAPSVGRFSDVSQLVLAPDDRSVITYTSDHRLVHLDTAWLDGATPFPSWERARLQAELAAVRRIRPQGRLQPMDLTTWAELRRRLEALR